MSGTYLAIFAFYMHQFASAFDCNQIRSDKDIKILNWETLEECVIEIGRNQVDKNASENIWRLIKTANDGLENISPSVYKNMGNLLTGIPLDDLRNITIDVIEIVKAFGSVRKGFSEEQLNLIAQKVHNEWSNKKPKMYSEYDLISMGQIVCYLNRSDIAEIHADAFRFAAEWIGNLENCPADRLQAFAQLAVQSDAFGPPYSWSKLDVSILGNILKRLSPSEIEAISKEKLRLNKHFKMKSNESNSTGASKRDTIDVPKQREQSHQASGNMSN